MKGKIKQHLEKAVADCDSTGQWGSISAGTRAQLRELLNNDIPWETVLKQFCGLSRRADRASSVRRINRKYPGIHPGTQRNYKASIAVYIDQSGSVGDSDLELFFGTLLSLAKHVEFVLYNFDTEVDEASERVWNRTRNPGLERTRCGGTDFRAPTAHANKNMSRFDGYLIMTDGEAPDPGPSKLRRGWVICPDRDLIFTPSSRDFVIKMKDRNAKAA